MLKHKHGFAREMIPVLLLLNFFIPRGEAQTAPENSSPAAEFKWAGTNFVARGGWGRMIRLTNGGWLCVNRVKLSGSNAEIRVLLCESVTRGLVYVSASTIARR